MSSRSSKAAELYRAGLLAGARAASMMWPDYLEGERGARCSIDLLLRAGNGLPIVTTGPKPVATGPKPRAPDSRPRRRPSFRACRS
jgi:hypothetical protein